MYAKAKETRKAESPAAATAAHAPVSLHAIWSLANDVWRALPLISKPT